MCKSELVETEVEKDLGMLGTSAQAAAKGIGSIGVSLLSFLVCSVHDSLSRLCVSLRVLLPRLPCCFPLSCVFWPVPLLCAFVYVRAVWMRVWICVCARCVDVCVWICVCARDLCLPLWAILVLCPTVRLSPFPFPAVFLRVWCAACRGVGVTATFYNSAPGGVYHTSHTLQTSVSLVSHSISLSLSCARIHVHIHPHSYVLIGGHVVAWGASMMHVLPGARSQWPSSASSILRLLFAYTHTTARVHARVHHTKRADKAGRAHAKCCPMRHAFIAAGSAAGAVGSAAGAVGSAAGSIGSSGGGGGGAADPLAGDGHPVVEATPLVEAEPSAPAAEGEQAPAEEEAPAARRLLSVCAHARARARVST